MTEVIVALDLPRADEAVALATRLRGIVPWLKVGLELFLDGGQSLLGRLKELDFQIFLDLKFMDIPNTVQAAVRQGTSMGANMLTLHCLGGQAMCAAALAGREQGLAPGQARPLLLGVTVLTSMGPADLVWNSDMTQDALHDEIVRLAMAAQAWKLDGVVCSGRELRAIRTQCGEDFRLLTPGIRLPDADQGDQTRICTPEQAARDGSNFLVVGRPITRAAQPEEAAWRYVEATAGM